jgi:hypothetical protein
MKTKVEKKIRPERTCRARPAAGRMDKSALTGPTHLDDERVLCTKPFYWPVVSATARSGSGPPPPRPLPKMVKVNTKVSPSVSSPHDDSQQWG